MEFKKLYELASVDISNVDKKTKEGESKVRLCNFVDVYHNWALKDAMVDKLMTATANNNQITRFKLHSGQVAITKDSETKDDIGVSMLVNISADNVVLGYHCALITPDETLLSASYLNFVLHSSYASKYFENNASGSGQRYTLTNDIIGNFPVPIVSLSEQGKIASIFDRIDEKIGINNAIISELEAMAKDIYDYWFVQFDFPDENGKPYKSSGGKMVWNEELKREVPEGWKEIEINKMFESKRGISYNTEAITGEGIPMINLASFNVNSTYKKEGLKSYSGKYSDEDIIRPYDLLMCNTQQTDLDPTKDIIGKTILVPDIFGGSDIVASHHVTRLLCTKSEYKSYIDASSKTAWFHKAMTANCSGTSIMGLNSDLAFKYQIILPDANRLSNFNDLYMQIKKKESVLLNENSELTALRDFLLPVLMNGQVKIRKDPGNEKPQS